MARSKQQKAEQPRHVRPVAGYAPAKKTQKKRPAQLIVAPSPLANRFRPWARRLRMGRAAHYWLSRKGMVRLLEIAGVGIVVLFLLVVGAFAFFRKDLPQITNLAAANEGGSVAYYDRTGQQLLWVDYSSVKTIPVSSGSISPYMKEATVAIEDKNFYHEGALDFRSVFRAFTHDVFHLGHGLEGASTITEQVVKLNKGWPDPLSINHKIQEAILAEGLSRQYSKDDILTAYLNIAPYGNVDYGVQAAASDYFHTTADKLTLAQAAFLASIPRAPTVYSPYSSPKYNSEATANYFDSEDLISRQHYVLDQMAQQHLITQAQANAAKQVDILAQVQPLQSKYHNIQDPYFVLTAKQQLLNQYGSQLLQKGSWKVTTTLNTSLQQLANTLVAKNVPNITPHGADEEALVAEQAKTGQVVSLVGGTDFNNPDHGQVNYANVNLSPGSSIKPYVYATFINNPKNNAGAGSVLYDNQQALPGYSCTNKNKPTNGGNCLWDYDFRYPGAETIRYALAGSRNVPAVKAGLMATLPAVQNTFDSMAGYKNAYQCFPPGTNVETATTSQASPCYGSAAIGEGGYLHLNQEVSGMSTFANMGAQVPQTYILKVQNTTGKTVYQWTQPRTQQVINQDTAYIIDNMLSDPRATYLPGSCSATTCTPLYRGGYKWQRYNGWDIAVKTGTTHDDISGLMTAWSTQYAVVTWVGYHTADRPLTGAAMEYMTEPLARGWMQGALDDLHQKPVNWQQPSDIKTDPAYVIHNHVGIGSEEPSPATDIYPSWYKPPAKASSGPVSIDKVSGLLATSCTPPDAIQTSTGSSDAATFSVDKFYNANGQAAPQGSDNIHQCSDVKPALTLTPPANNTCNSTDNNGQGCLITATVTQGTYPLSSTKFPGSFTVTVDGKTLNTYSLGASPDTISFYYDPTTTGSVTITGTATDSVLYQTTSSVTLTTTSSGGGSGGSPPGQQKKNGTILPVL